MAKMNNSRPIESVSSMTVGDIYYVLFRHKWAIIVLALAGLAAAAVYRHYEAPLFESEAELLIKYVPEAKTPVLGGETIQPNSEVEDVINTEVQILTSLDLAEQVATNIGPANILARAGGGDDPLAAATLVHNNIGAAPAGHGSSVIIITFSHPNPQIVQPVLRELIEDYTQKHKEIHQAAGQFDDNLNRELADLGANLNETETRLEAVENSNKIVSLQGAKSEVAEQISKIQADVLDAKAELEQFGIVAREAGQAPAAAPTTNVEAVIPQDQIDAYQDASYRLGNFRQQRQDFIKQGFSPQNALVLTNQIEIAKAERNVADLEKEYPGLKSYVSSNAQLGGQKTSASGGVAVSMDDQIGALKARIGALTWQENQLWEEASNLKALSPEITELQRQKEILETNYQTLAVGLSQTHINDDLMASSKAPNIRTIQTPSPPFQQWKKANEQTAMVAVSGIVLGLAWAFLIELYFDRSVKRPIEVENKLNMPLFLSIPELKRNGHAKLPRAAARRQLNQTNPTDGEQAADGANLPVRRDTGVHVVSLEKNRPLNRFFDALRDRLVLYFEVKNLTHNPKLVAVTSVNSGSGVSTIAAGLASSLSETGEGNVLLVDMNLEHAVAHQFYQGKPVCSLDKALAGETRNHAQVQENLYVVSEQADGDQMPRILPKRFSSLMPKFRASEYDYIIFDMPPVTQTSATPRVARFMDMVLMVIESEKTDRDAVQRANKILVESGATVSAVLNKTRKYVPTSLHQGNLGDA